MNRIHTIHTLCAREKNSFSLINCDPTRRITKFINLGFDHSYYQKVYMKECFK